MAFEIARLQASFYPLKQVAFYRLEKQLFF